MVGLDLGAEDFIGGRVLEEEEGWMGVEDERSSFVFSVSRQCKNLQFAEFLQPLAVLKYIQTGIVPGAGAGPGPGPGFVAAVEDVKGEEMAMDEEDWEVEVEGVLCVVAVMLDSVLLFH